MWQRIKSCLSSDAAHAAALPEPGDEESPRRPARLFGAVVLLYILHQLVLQPGWTLGGEMWAEMATNYFPNAQAPDFMQRLLATDAGYVPLVQRVLALAGALLNLPATSIPYFYTGSAVLLTGVLAGAFCLRDFRPLVRSDALRFLTALAVLAVADFPTRTFINFTYYAAFFVSVVTALAWVQRDRPLPGWAWSLPVLVIAKPAVMAALPGMLVVALRAGPRFRRITVAALACGVAQLSCIALHQQEAGPVPSAGVRVLTAVKYFMGLAGTYLPGPHFTPPVSWRLATGGLCIVLLLWLCRRRRHPAAPLVVLGLSLLLFNMLINAFALPGDWNRDMARLGTPEIYRHVIVGFFGCVLAMSGMAAMLFPAPSGPRRLLAPLAFGAWFLASGWFQLGLEAGREPGSPTLNNSQWQSKALALETGEPVVCIPIDPFIWTFGRQCVTLNPAMDMGQAYRLPAPRPDDKVVLEWTPPPAVQDRELVSVGLLVRPATHQPTLLSAQAVVTTATGEQHRLYGNRTLPAGGGLLLLEGLSGTVAAQPRRVLIEFNQPVEVRYSADELPTALWMGLPKAP